MTQISKLKTEFLEHCEIEKNCSLYTLRNYDHYLTRFLGWSRISKPSDITQELVRKYRIFLNRVEDDKGNRLKKITQNYHVIAIRAFLKYLAKRDVKALAPEKLELADTPTRTVEFLEPEELERLFESPKTTTLLGTRDRAILEMLFSTGLRVSELVKLDRASINILKGEFSVRGKGDKPRIVFLSEPAKYWVSLYLKKRSDTSKALFVREDRARKKESQVEADEIERGVYRLSPRTIQRIVKKHATRAGIVKKVTPHVLRHSYATDLLSNGADLRSVQSLLGHSSVTTTQIYTHVTNRQLKEVHSAFHRRRNK